MENGSLHIEDRSNFMRNYFYKGFVERDNEDKLFNKIKSLGLEEELFSDQNKFISEFDVTQSSYTTAESADLLEIKSGGQRLVNIINDKNRDFNSYLDPGRIGVSYKFEHSTLFKFYMIFFLLGKGYDINDVAEWQGLIAPTSKPRAARPHHTTTTEMANNEASNGNTEMVFQIVGKVVEAVKEMQTDNVNFMERLVDFNSESSSREISAMRIHLQSKMKEVENSKAQIQFLKANILEPLVKKEWGINEKIQSIQNNAPHTNTPVVEPEPKKSFFQRLFGGGEPQTVASAVQPMQPKQTKEELISEQETLLTEIDKTNTEIENIQLNVEAAIKEVGELEALIGHLEEQKIEVIEDLKAEIPTVESLPILNSLIGLSQSIGVPSEDVEEDNPLRPDLSSSDLVPSVPGSLPKHEEK